MSRYYDSSSSLRRKRFSEDVDPMSSMGNIGDVMLVFACGLMVALVVAWNVDLAQFEKVDSATPLGEDASKRMTEQLYGEGQSFEEMGKVYRDPATGDLYLVEEGGDSSEGDEGDE